MRWTEPIETVFCSRRAGALAGAAWAALILGCMSISVGGKHVTTGHHDDGAFVQEGKVRLGPGCEQSVYYPIPYSGPPNLELDCGLNQCVLVEQKEDHFRISNTGVWPRTVDWTARGLKCSQPSLPGLAPLPPVPTLPPPRPVTSDPADGER